MGRETYVQLFDFDTVMLSVLPLSYFRKFLASKRESLLSHLTILMHLKRLIEAEDTLGEK